MNQRIPSLLAGAALLALLGGSADAAGLADVPRTLVKEPAYKGAPAYCLLVLGTDLKTRVWIVRDGDTVYVDRNGNGDLTEAGERVTATSEVDDGDEVRVTTTEYALGDLPLVGGKKVYSELTLRRFLVEPKAHGAVKGSDVASLGLTLRETSTQSATPTFAATAAQAPLAHLDGPLSVQFAPTPKEEPPVLFLGVEGQELTVQIGTQGLGAGTWAPMGYELVPDEVKPVLEITFPPAKAGAAPVTAKYTLDDRC